MRNSKKISKSKIATSITAIGLSAAILVGGSFAWYSSVQSAQNKFKTLPNEVLLHDVFGTKDNVADLNGDKVYDGQKNSEQVIWNTGTPTNKDVFVENTGEGPIFVRLKLTETIEGTGTYDAGPAVFKGTGTGSSVTGEVKDGVFADWTTGAGIVTSDPDNATSFENGVWIMSDDGWAYWSKPLAKGETTGKILDSVQLLVNPNKDSTYTIDIDMDAVSADEEGLGETQWNDMPSVIKAVLSDQVEGLKVVTKKNDTDVFPDDGLRAAIFENFDTNNDGVLNNVEISSSGKNDGALNITTDMGIKDVTGLDKLTGIRKARISNQSELATADFSKCKNIDWINLNNNPSLTTIKVPNTLKVFEASSLSKLTSIDGLKDCTNLEYVSVISTPKLVWDGDFSSMTNLHFATLCIAGVDNALIASLPTSVKYIDISHNSGVTTLPHKFNALQYLDFAGTGITDIDISGYPLNGTVTFDYDKLSSLTSGIFYNGTVAFTGGWTDMTSGSSRP